MEAVKPVQLKICQTNNYRKDFSWLHFDDEPRNHKGQKVKDQQFDISIFVVYQTSPNRTNKSSNFLRGSFSSRDNVRAQTQFTRERQPQHLKRWFFLKNRSTYCHINTQVLQDLSNETSRFLPQSTVCCRSDSSLAATSNYFHKSDAWSHLG